MYGISPQGYFVLHQCDWTNIRYKSTICTSENMKRALPSWVHICKIGHRFQYHQESLMSITYNLWWGKEEKNWAEVATQHVLSRKDASQCLSILGERWMKPNVKWKAGPSLWSGKSCRKFQCRLKECLTAGHKGPGRRVSKSRQRLPFVWANPTLLIQPAPTTVLQPWQKGWRRVWEMSLYRVSSTPGSTLSGCIKSPPSPAFLHKALNSSHHQMQANHTTPCLRNFTISHGCNPLV